MKTAIVHLIFCAWVAFILLLNESDNFLDGSARTFLLVALIIDMLIIFLLAVTAWIIYRKIKE